MAEPAPLPSDPIAEAHRQWHEHGWADAADGMAAVTAIMRTQQILMARIEGALKPFDLTFSRFELLRLLSFTRHGSLPMAFASSRLQVHPTSVTNAVDRLEAAKLVKRMPHPTDGRATLIEITPAGRERVDAATSELNDSIFRRTGFDAREVEQLNALLTGFRRDAGDFEK
ncbi:MAG: MarR family transcriptional regulator [Pseudolysinimonas sp.]